MLREIVVRFVVSEFDVYYLKIEIRKYAFYAMFDNLNEIGR